MSDYELAAFAVFLISIGILGVIASLATIIVDILTNRNGPTDPWGDL